MLIEASDSDEESLDSLWSFHSKCSDHVEVQIDKYFSKTAENMPHATYSNRFVSSKAIEIPNEHFELNKFSCNDLECSCTSNAQS